MTTVRVTKVNHINLVLRDCGGALAHFAECFGAEHFADVASADAHQALFEIGHVIFEIFSPRMWLLNARYGAHHVGVEFRVESLEAARAALAERGMGIVRELGIAVHSDPAALHGTSLEFYEGEFHEGRYERLGGRGLRGPGFWRDEHPLQLTGLKAITWAVRDAAGVRDTLLGMLDGAAVAYAVNRPAIAARAIGVAVGDTVLELLEPDGPGALSDTLRDHGEGLRSTVFASADMAAVRTWCAARGVPLEQGTGYEWVQVPAAANHGVLFEFAPA